MASMKLSQPRPKMDQVGASAPIQDASATAALSSVEGTPPTADVPAVEYPKDLYDLAHAENDRRNFEGRLADARRPVVKEYVPPPIPEQIAAATKLEMEAGRARVADFAQMEAKRQAQMAQPRKKEPWEGTNTPVFRPGEFDEYKGTLKSPVLTQSKDIRR